MGEDWKEQSLALWVPGPSWKAHGKISEDPGAARAGVPKGLTPLKESTTHLPGCLPAGSPFQGTDSPHTVLFFCIPLFFVFVFNT